MASSFLWKMMERVGAQGIQLIIQIVLARLLAPTDYGIIALVTIFITLATVMVQSGLNTSLIQKKEVDEKDYSTVFWVSMGLAVTLYGVLYFCAPIIADFYYEPMVTDVLRVIGIVLFFNAVNSVQNAYLVKNFLFKKLFKSTLIATIISGATGIVMAYAGLGVWALVAYQILNSLFSCLIMWFTVKWRPSLTFSISRLKALWKYGWKILVAYTLDTVYREVQALVLGKISDTKTLGYYNRGQQIPAMVNRCTNDTIKSVILPIYSEYQDDKEQLKQMIRKSQSIVTFIVFPVMAGLAVTSPALTEILLTEKWMPSVPFAQILCLAYIVQPLISIYMQAINAIGRSDIFCWTVYFQLGVSLIILYITAQISVYAVAYGVVIGSFLQWIMYIFVARKMFGYKISELFKDIYSSVLLTGGMFIVTQWVNYWNCSAWIKLPVQIVVGVVVYSLLAMLFKTIGYRYVWNYIKGRKKDE